jgi:hypothetical protein
MDKIDIKLEPNQDLYLTYEEGEATIPAEVIERPKRNNYT